MDKLDTIPLFQETKMSRDFTQQTAQPGRDALVDHEPARAKVKRPRPRAIENKRAPNQV
jgi:hypothetical protein